MTVDLTAEQYRALRAEIEDEEGTRAKIRAHVSPGLTTEQIEHVVEINWLERKYRWAKAQKALRDAGGAA